MIMVRTFSRRRAIAIFAAAAGLPLLTGTKVMASDVGTRAVTWSGQALGAPATLILHHQDPVRARILIDRVVAEVSRLEAIFSLYREDSALVELNRVGALAAPPNDLVTLLQSCRTFCLETGSAFDPTVQPLWALYRDHFSAPNADPSGPPPTAIQKALSLVGFNAVAFDRDRIVLPRPNAALTLNGVAQGYITDRIVDLLRDAGVTSSLVDMGEDRAIGRQANGTLWRVGLAASEDATDPDTVIGIDNKAVATSSAEGFHFDEAERFGHILDPRNGSAPSLYRRMTVIANDAATADAFSTAFCLLDQGDIRQIVSQRPDLTIDLVDTGGVHARFGATV
jgi:thiamine biosynthesis lipoprotein